MATIPCVTNETQPEDFFYQLEMKLTVSRGVALYATRWTPRASRCPYIKSCCSNLTWTVTRGESESQLTRVRWYGTRGCYSTPGPSYWLTVNRTTSLSPRSSNEMCEHIDYLNQLNNFFESTSWIKRQKSYIKIINQCFLHASKPDSVFLTNCRRNAKYVHVLVVDFRVWFKEHKVRVQWMSIS